MPLLSQKILIPLFQSITCRTAGFNTVDISSLRDATLAMMIFLMGDSTVGSMLNDRRESFLAYLFETVSAFGRLDCPWG